MQWQNVGSSGLTVSRVGLGTMTWGQDADEETAREQLRLFTEAGGTLVGTAARYSDGRAEAMLGDLIGDTVARSELVLAVQGGSARQHGGVRRADGSRKGLLDSLDASLARLGTDHVDLWLAPARLDAVPLDETLGALELAYRTGRARYVGVSNQAGWELALASATAGFPLTAHEAEYSLLNRTVEREATPAAEALGVGLVAWAPLGRGVLTGKYRGQTPADSRAASDLWAPYVEPYLTGRPQRITEALVTAAKGLDLAPLEVALRWVLHRPTVAAAMTGARTSHQLKDVLSAGQDPLPAQISAVLDEVSAQS
ncbi:aldo/keto reductase [Arthrobacter sp. Bz4]|uniref:aldo/keto reductase n=1 Tax=Arthrobacter sp. Bz4 TaxID=2171979 RepID=UPI000D50A351|nr:aldo/keto reductase [Arthrobacter sp. Bz4]PVE19873.1 aldo/keto reductase [Arthrobacter sp. Bz4]